MRSLNTGFEEMCSLVSDFEFDAFGVTETWLCPDTPSTSFMIPGYTLLRSDRQSKDEIRGGGVALYLKEGHTYDQHFLSSNVAPGIEYICVVLKVKGLKLGVCVVYRPPSIRYTCFEALFHALFVDLAVEVNSVIYIGDSNIDLLTIKSPDTKYIRRLMREYSAVQVINEATRVTESSKTLIDHIITDKSVELVNTGVIDAPSIVDSRGMSITDHKLVYCDVLCRREKMGHKFVRYRNFSRFDLNKAVTHLSEMNWDEVKETNDVEKIETFIREKILKIYNEYAPMVCKKVTKKYAPWRSKQIIELTKEKNKSLNKFRKSKQTKDWETYKVIRNRLNNYIRRSKKDYFSVKLTSKESSKEFWSCLKKCDVVGKKQNESLFTDLNVEDANKYFVDMGSGSTIDMALLNFFKDNKKYDELECFNFTAVTDDEVKSAMNEIKSRAVGSDDISIEMIKAVSPYALGAIVHLVNQCLANGIFPHKWKTSIIHPLPKVTLPTTVQQLRPISILPAMSKIVEKVVIRQLMTHVTEKQILPKLQSGFRKNYSTCTALTNLFSDLFEEKDKGRLSSLVMLDYSQAFDSINHEMLLAKMRYYGFSDGVVTWLRSYLEDRQQVTKLGNAFSKARFKSRGVPQGSCLGPILFNLYTSDLPHCVSKGTVHMYADDCQLHLAYNPEKMETAIYQLNSDLQNVHLWSASNGLKLNVSKCSVLHTAPVNLVQALSVRGVTVELNGESLAVCEKVKTLGVVLDRDLTFSDHVTYSMHRALGRLRGLYRFKSLLPEYAKLRLIQSVVLSVFSYCYPAYGNSISKGDISRIQKLQNSTIRFVFNLRCFDHVTPYRAAADLIPMDSVCKILTCCMVHKVLKIREPRYLSEKLMYREEVAHRSTRQDFRLHFPKVKLEVGRKGFTYFAPNMINSIPLEIVGTSCKNFKSKVKEMVCTLSSS